MQIPGKKAVWQVTQKCLQQASDGVGIPLFVYLNQVDIAFNVKSVFQTFDNGRGTAKAIYALLNLGMFDLQILYAPEDDSWQIGSRRNSDGIR